MSDHDLADVAPPGAAISALAVNEDGTVIVERTPDRAVHPASNTKLVTAALALDELDPAFRFETSLFADGETADGTLDEDLRLIGSGAPDLDPTDVRTLAAGVADRLTRVTGDLLLDASLFDGPPHAPGVTWEDHQYAYGAPTAALSLDENTVTVTVEGDGSDAFAASVDPESPVVEIAVGVLPATAAQASENTDETTAEDAHDPDTTTMEDRDGADVTIRTDVLDGRIRVEGELRPDGHVSGVAPIRRPVVHAGSVLLEALGEAGVAVEGDVARAGSRLDRAADHAGKHPEHLRTTPIARVESAPLRELVGAMNVDSNNFVADMLARAVAAHATGTGSWEAWSALTADRFGDLGVEIGRVRDGSGLSRYNRLSASAIVALLRWAADSDWAPAFFDSLPTPGEGTLADRLDGVPVVAKTGTLTGVRALSGRIARDDGPIYFSLLVGDVTVDADRVRDRLDAVVRSLAEE